MTLPAPDDRAGPTPAPAEPDELAPPREEPTVFGVLAARARGHSRSHLSAAAVIGAIDAAALGVAHPALWWLASASVSLSAYGVWGLADRALAEQPPSTSRGRALALRAARVGAATVGTAAAVAILLGLMDAALGGWRH